MMMILNQSRRRPTIPFLLDRLLWRSTSTIITPSFLEASLEVPSSPSSTFHTNTSLLLLNPQHTYILQTKGYSKLNADGTGIGIVLKNDDDDDDDDDENSTQCTARHYFPSDRALSLAEYSALIVGLQYAIQLGAQHLILETDHAVLAKQLQGIFPMEKRIMKPLYWQVMHLVEERLQSFRVRIVPDVNEATELAKRALATNKSSLLLQQQQGDPMGQHFTGQGKQRKPSLPPLLIPMTASQQQASSDTNDDENIVRQAMTKDDESSDDNSNYSSTSNPNNNPTQDATIIDPQRTYLLQFDGGARGNPAGKSGCGMVLFDDQGHEVWCGWKYLKPPMSNNMAEYHSILLGLLCAKSLGIQRIQAQGDSELVVKQLNGVYQVRDPKLKELWGPTRDVMKEFQTISVTHIAREYNKRADWLANHAMDTETSFGFEEH
ncbi:hypothetical protein FisN_12Hh072 [Fistulifera solaris]|uniref:RNase H type-1 domain-containing protein n=1 Tax=Fistulifera solaris TaxID=1519565 RepID=A0A1Z5K1T1_FISSO|nr:hypothetical protein FisN_12Hh072 [Fistulifera solaris]|eukprot:GAX20225.1 hypothetical protein FisN_12Hh072 [Fistulifera solaris]